MTILNFVLLLLLVNISIAVSQAECDDLVPEYCLLPYPSDYYRVGSDNNGYHLNFSANTFPIDDNGNKMDPTEWNQLHGFPVLPAITTYFRNIDDDSLSACGKWYDIDASLNDNSPIILLDTKTMERVPHWVELDHSSNKTDIVGHIGKQALLIWPATALDFDRRYIVAIRDTLLDKSRSPLPTSPLFEYLRGSTSDTSDDIRIINRWKHFNTNIFPLLNDIGINAEELVVAWDFTTNDKQDVTGRMVAARDDALARIGPDGPDYRITSVEYNTTSDDLVGRNIKGQFKMPLYLTTHLPTKDARLVLDEETGLPVFQDYAWFDFEVIVPSAFLDSPGSAGILQYGHGLFGSYKEVDYGSSTYLHEDATKYGYVLAASSWLGLSEADIPAIASMMLTDLSDFPYIPDRITQGVVNALGLMAMMRGSFSRDVNMLTSTTGEPIINTEKVNYFGNSCGGILGTVYMALTQDVERGLIGVGGAPFGMILPRSIDYSIEFAALKARYSDPVDRINLEQIMQMIWDRSEPVGYMTSINKDTLPNTPKHQILLHYGLADAQVSSLASHALARATDAVIYASNAKEHDESFFGLEIIDDDKTVITDRSGIVGWDYKSAQIPVENKPPGKDGDTHEMPRRDSRAQEQMGHFFFTGEIINTCGGTCISDPIE